MTNLMLFVWREKLSKASSKFFDTRIFNIIYDLVDLEENVGKSTTWILMFVFMTKFQ